VQEEPPEVVDEVESLSALPIHHDWSDRRYETQGAVEETLIHWPKRSAPLPVGVGSLVSADGWENGLPDVGRDAVYSDLQQQEMLRTGVGSYQRKMRQWNWVFPDSHHNHDRSIQE